MRVKRLLMVVLFIVIGIVVFGNTLTYASYTDNVSNYGFLNVAKWTFLGDNKNTVINININDTYDESTLSNGKIAPGTSGVINLKLNNANTETGVKFNVKINEIVNAPNNLKFYTDKEMTKELSSNGIEGTLKHNDIDGIDINIYWKWLYIVDDIDNDTYVGMNVSELVVPIEIVGTQYDTNVTELIDL